MNRYAQQPTPAPHTRRPTPMSRSPAPLMQQRSASSCACGGSCPRCNKKPDVQPKLQVSQPGDALEREADQVAEQVMRIPQGSASHENPSVSPVATALQRQAMPPSSNSGTAAVDASAISDLGAGRPLSAQTRAFFEPRFGADFGTVRVHDHPRAHEAAHDLGANAFTAGQDIYFGRNRFQPNTPAGKQLLAHELTHTIQQGGAGATLIQRDEFEPWPGQIGTDVAGTRTETADTIRERVQRTYDPAYTNPMPILLEFYHGPDGCRVTSSMEINFIHPSDASVRLSDARFNRLKTRILDVANSRLNGWITLNVRDGDGCDLACPGGIDVRVVATEGSSADASTVVLQSGTGRANAGRIYEGGDNWFSALLGGVSDGTLWHEAGHIVLGLPDEYEAAASSRVNENDFSVQASHSNFGRRARMHPRHFSFIPAWLERRFPSCTFDMQGTDIGITIDIVPELNLFAFNFGGNWGGGEMLDVALGIPLTDSRQWRLLLGGYGGAAATFEGESRGYLLAGVRAGVEYARNPSGGGFALRADLMGGAATFGTETDENAWVPTIGGGLQAGFVGPNINFMAFGNVSTSLEGPDAGNPYYMLGLRIGMNLSP